MNLIPGTVIAERFRLVHPLGQGGMGTIWRAQHLRLDIPCALKFIHAETAASAKVRARFEREAKVAAQLRSPHVVQILDHGVFEGMPYMAMELLEGEDLAARIERLGRLDARATLSIASQVARALSKAHAAGLVHRDLKPANIFISRDDDREIVKVLDFGVAKVIAHGLEDAATKTGTLLGTPFYMSPEQGRGTRAVDHRSDLWALGVVVYQCLTGQLPFQSTALGDLLMKIMTEPLPVPSQVAPVPPGFDAWWMQACARDPAQRFQNAKELIDALAVALGISAGGAVDLGLGTPALGAARPQMPSWPEPAGTSAHISPPTPNAGGTMMLTPSAGATPAPAHTGGPVVSTAPNSVATSPKSRSAGLLVVGIFSLLTVGGVAALFLARGSAEAQSSNETQPVVEPAASVAEPELPAASASSEAEPIEVAPSASASAEPMASAALPLASSAPAAGPAPAAPTARPSVERPSGPLPPSPSKPSTKPKPTATTAPKPPDLGI